MTQPNIYVVPSDLGRKEPVATPDAAVEQIPFADFSKIQPGDEVTFTRIINAQDVENFAKLSGDRNPLHMNERFAARTHFQRRVVHGMLLANYVSALVGMRCPGPGALWNQQNFRWLSPAFIGDNVTIILKVLHKSTGARALTIQVKATNQEGRLLMEGDGTVTALQEIEAPKEVPITERVAFVSGGSRGIGAAIASALAEAGAAVVINYRTRADVADEVSGAIRASGGRALALQADVTDGSSVSEAIRRAQDHFNHPVDLLINNAGSLPEPRAFAQTTWENVQALLDVHVRGAFYCCQAAIPGMMQQKSGRIVNIGSVFTRGTPPANWSSVLIAKSAMQAMTRCLATELGPHGIRVNMVLPGLVETESIAALPDRLRKVQAMQTPLRRLATPADIAAVVRALCTSMGDFVTGTEIPVCGGFQM
jgi:3-oxoacyl-[acyl-carrier protein] reductase